MHLSKGSSGARELVKISRVESELRRRIINRRALNVNAQQILQKKIALYQFRTAKIILYANEISCYLNSKGFI